MKNEQFYLKNLEQESRKSFSIRRFCYNHDKFIYVVILIVACIIGFIFSWNFFHNPLTEEQFQYLENVAASIYTSETKSIFNQPNNISIKVFNDAISCSYDSIKTQNRVLITSQDGNMILTRDYGYTLLFVEIFSSSILSMTLAAIISNPFFKYLLNIEYDEKT